MKILLVGLVMCFAAGCAAPPVPKPDISPSALPLQQYCKGKWVVREVRGQRGVVCEPSVRVAPSGIPYGAQIVGYVTPPPPAPPDQYGRYQSPPSYMLAPIPVYATPLPFSCLWPCVPYRYGNGNGFTFIMKF